ncbi:MULTISPECIES: anthrone oxygenase family protein [unclassified Knoellia]|uniref:anthrone oxygenase family protein n=1 Tax=Knoellia altitudinis TaxID=3404795 RepID=UPI003613FDFE
MSDTAWVLAATAVSSTVFAGAMFAFSAFVLPALGDLAPRDGILAMQAMNVRAPASLLLLPMGGVGVGSVAVVVMALAGDGPDRAVRIVGALLALASVAITGIGNIPLNNQLAGVDADVATAVDWQGFAGPWLAWNAARSLTGLAGGVLLAVAAARA